MTEADGKPRARAPDGQTTEVQVLRNVSSEINATLDLGEIFEIVLHTMDELFGFRHTLILLLDESGSELEVVASRGYGGHGIGARVAVGTGVIGVVAKKRRMMRVANLRQQRRYMSAVRREVERRGGEVGAIVELPGLPDAESQIAIPMMIKDSLIGVFAVETPDPRPFGERDETLASIVANQAAAAIQNARLYDSLRQLNESLEERVQVRTRELELANVELRQTQAQLAQSSKMASLGMLAAGVAHEINTPIASVASSQETLSAALKRLAKLLEAHDEGATDARVQRFVDVMLDSSRVISMATDRVTEIVKRLRSFARLDEADRKSVDVHECIRDTLNLVGHELRSIRVEEDFGDLPKVMCFPGRLNQVLLNVVMNARQAIDEGGLIRVATSVVGDEAHIAITDDGVGIRAEDLARIFDPGFTTKGVGVGTGLGLSICYQIMQDHRGEIRVESEPGHGSTFTIVLPISDR